MSDIILNKASECAVIGYGSWATAIVKTLCENENKVHWFIRNNDIIESINESGVNVKYLREVELDIDKLHISSDINEIVESAEIVILAMPSAFIKDFLKDLTVPLDNKFIISAIKGIVQGDYKTPIEYIHDQYNIPFRNTCIITGPTHAEEVGGKKTSFLTVVCPNESNCDVIGKKFSTSYMNVTFSQDLYGIEYAAILKNIYAIAAGIAAGLGYGDNFLAVLISNCSKELSRYINESYSYERNTGSSAYLGDLLVTCYSNFSRNRRLGLLIGRGCSVKSALNEMTMIAEGYFAAECIRHLNQKHKVDMPIADMVYSVLYEGVSARKAMSKLIPKLV